MLRHSIKSKKSSLLFGVVSMSVFFVLFGPAQENRAPQKQQGDLPAKPPTPGAKVTGRVLRADAGAPLPKALVTLSPEGGRTGIMAARTDTGGLFQFSDVAPGRYRLAAERNGYVRLVYGQRGGGPGIVFNLEPGQRLEKVEFRLVRAGVISGAVLDEDNEPVEGIEVRAQRVRFLPGGRLRLFSVKATRTDDLGNFRLPGLIPGSYYVQAGGRGEGVSIGGPTSPLTYSAAYYPGAMSREDAERVQVTAGNETARIDIAVHSMPTFTVSGVVIDTTSASPRRYSVGFASGGAIAMTAVDRDDGTFALSGLEPGEYTLVASVSDETKGVRQGYRSVRVVDADVRVAIEIGHTAELRGEVQVGHEKGFSFAGLYVNLQPEEESSVAVSATVDEKGRFAIRNVPEGRYSVQLSGREQEIYLKEARCRTEDFTQRPLTLAASETVDDCVLLLGRDSGEVGGQVAKNDEPVSGSVVVLIPVEPERRRIARHTATGQADANGQFQIRGVVPGDYFVFAVPPSDDATYNDLEFVNRNRDSATLLTVKPKGHQHVDLKFMQPR